MATAVRPSPVSSRRARPLYKDLSVQILAAMVLGSLVGYLWPQSADSLRPLGDLFIRLVRMLVAPIIFCTVVHGIASVGEAKRVGRVAIKTLIYFEIVTTIALALGLIVVNVVRPGAGMNVDAAALDGASVAQYIGAGKGQSVVAFLLDIIPASIVDAFVRGDILQVLLVSVLFGFALKRIGAAGPRVAEFIEWLGSALFVVVGLIMKTAPLGAFGAMAFTIGNFGVGTLAQLGKVILCFYAACLLFVFAVLGPIAWWHGFGIWRFVTLIKEEIFIVFGTSSSESVLPRIMEKLEDLGVRRSVVGVVIPAGYSFNLDGTAVYLAIATVFIAQATNTPLGVSRQVMLLALLLITSKGAAGVAGAALIALTGTLAATGDIPVAGVALILGIHRFMGEAMAVTNLIGNGVATIVIGKRCGEVDEARLAERLGGAESRSDHAAAVDWVYRVR
jgi:aerobic C4-dicarboxylate transport protein